MASKTSLSPVQKTFPHIGWDPVRTHLRQTLKVRREGVRRRQRRASAADSNAAAAATPPPVRMVMGDVELGTGADKCRWFMADIDATPSYTCGGVSWFGRHASKPLKLVVTVNVLTLTEDGKGHPALAEKETTHALLLPKIIPINTSPRTVYAARKRDEAAGWRAIHDTLLATGAELSAPTSFRCTICKEEQPTAIYRCQDCGPTATFCKECLIVAFNLSWTKSALVIGMPIPVTGSSPRTVKVFDESGRPRVIDVDFCPCEPEPCTLLRLGLWAASTEAPATAFSVSLLEWLVVLSLECHISVEGFCNFYFRQYVYKQRTLQHVCPQLDEGTCCPVCPKSNGKQVILLDGNFGLVRKSSSGTSYAEPHHGTRMFADDDTVQGLMSTYSDATKPSEDCSNFQAGSRLRSKNKQTKLDVSGVFGAACRHEVPLLFVNMTHGESPAHAREIRRVLVASMDFRAPRVRPRIFPYTPGFVLAVHVHGNLRPAHLACVGERLTIRGQHRNEPANRQEEGLSESSEKKERKATAFTQKRARLEANRQTAHPGSDLKARAPTTQAGPAALPPGVHPAPSTPLRPDCDHNRHQHHAIPQTDMGQFVLPG
ncbi:hypothetical protein Bbelb_035740 [Branchiostoma belcheri]|nr:hypothetical protein Bbelb_035740 [Branchiostoma belcheri]